MSEESINAYYFMLRHPDTKHRKKAEKLILQSPIDSCFYAQNVLKCRFFKGEKLILNNKEACFTYIKMILKFNHG